MRILIADDHGIVRGGLRLLIERQPDMEVVAEAEDGQTAVRLAGQLAPDVVVMDVSMPRSNGLTATKTLHELHPDIQILTLTRHVDRGYVQQFLQAGASGYVLKQSASEELIRAIRAVASGRTYLDAGIMDVVVETVRLIGGARAGKSLTEREEQVLRLNAWGLLNREIAARLQVSIKTIETHKANAMTKLGLRSRGDIVRYAILQGWLKDS